MTDEQVLVELREAGLDSLPGGGAEIFAARVRRKICHDKCDGDRYLAIHRTAHRSRHAHQRHDALRPHRDDGGARRSPAAGARAAGRDARLPGVHPAGVSSRQQPDAQAAAAVGERHAARARGGPAAARQRRSHQGVLDFVGVEVAQTALWFGADDLDGTVQEETIYHMAGARTPSALSTHEIETLIRDAGREPIERDTLYNVVRVPSASPQARFDVTVHGLRSTVSSLQ